MDTHTAHVRAYFDPTTYCRRNAVIRLRERIIRDMLGDLRGVRILDAGCGDGSISVGFLEHNHVTFLDISAAMLKETAKRVPPEYSSRAELIQGNLLENRFSEQFDIVLCLGVIAYIKDTERVIQRVAEVLKPGGRFILQITDASTLLGKWLHHYAHYRGRITLSRTTRQQIVDVAFRCGLVFCGEERYPPSLPGMPFLGQLVWRKYLEWGHRRQLGCELVMEMLRVERS